MGLTDFHAKYFAHELTKRCASDSLEKLASVLADAQVDLNPHQLDAALFAFRSPFAKGAILADEVGLGKTIEAGLLLAQKWAERKRRLLVILPANLRKQWSQELDDKFYLPSVILESRSFNETIRAGNLNPFEQGAIVLCSYQYGQKFDVVVVNFLNKTNAADQRVYELLDEKFRLFSGVFGASDEVLGAVESGVDFEKRIAAIYQQCRTPEQIQFEFDQLQRELEVQIVEGQHDAREKLLDNFDQEVVEKVRIQSQDVLDRFNERLWRLTRHLLRDHARFEDADFSFMLHTNPFAGAAIHPGPYRMGKRAEDANTYRVGHPLAQRVLSLGCGLDTPPAEVVFRYRDGGKKLAILEPLVGKSGWLACVCLTVSAMETEDHLCFAGATDAGESLDDAQCRRLFDLSAATQRSCAVPEVVAAALAEAHARRQRELLEELTTRNGRWFDLEMDKLDRWAEDRRASLKATLDELDEALKAAKKAARLAPTLPEKLDRQREARVLEGKRDGAWRAFDQASREIDRQKDALLDEISHRLEQKTEYAELFTVRWGVA